MATNKRGPVPDDELMRRTCSKLSQACTEIVAAIETIIGEIDLGGEAIYVRANVEKATSFLDEVGTYLESQPGTS